MALQDPRERQDTFQPISRSSNFDTVEFQMPEPKANPRNNGKPKTDADKGFSATFCAILSNSGETRGGSTTSSFQTHQNSKIPKTRTRSQLTKVKATQDKGGMRLNDFQNYSGEINSYQTGLLTTQTQPTKLKLIRDPHRSKGRNRIQDKSASTT